MGTSSYKPVVLSIVSDRMQEDEEDGGLVLSLDKKDSDKESELHRKLSTIKENQKENLEGIEVDIAPVPEVSVPLLDNGKDRNLGGMAGKLRDSRESLSDKIRGSRDKFLEKLGLGHGVNSEEDSGEDTGDVMAESGV